MMITLGKILWFLVNPTLLLTLILWAGCALLFTRRARWGRRLVTLVAGVLGLLALLPVDEAATYVLETRFPPVAEPPAQVDGVLVLSGATDVFLTQAWGQPALNGSAERLTALVALARRYPQARLVWSGGSGSLLESALTESDVARMALEQIGFDAGRVTFEDRSRNTFQNAAFSRDLVRPAAGETWLLVTSAAHMPRAVGCFRKLGWVMQPYPVDFTATGRLDVSFTVNGMARAVHFGGVLREWVGLVSYFVMGHTDQLLPGASA